MRVSTVLVGLFVVFATLSCETEKAQMDQQVITQATPANVVSLPDNEYFKQSDAQTAQDKDWLSYWPMVVELKGKLIIRWYYGPPNYGENPKTDSRELLPILVLSKPVNVRGSPDPDAGPDRVSVEDVRKMELVLTIPHKNIIGKNVVVKGTLFHGFTGHHHTDVLMKVESISLAVPD